MTTLKSGQSNGFKNKYNGNGGRQSVNSIPTIATEDDLRKTNNKSKPIRKTRSVDENTNEEKKPPTKNMADGKNRGGRTPNRKDNGHVTRPPVDRQLKNLPPNSVVLAVFSPDDSRRPPTSKDGSDRDSEKSIPKAESRRSHRSGGGGRGEYDSDSEDDDERKHSRRRKRGSTKSAHRRRKTRSKPRRSESSESESDSYDDYDHRQHRPNRKSHHHVQHPTQIAVAHPALYQVAPAIHPNPYAAAPIHPTPSFMTPAAPSRPPVSPPAYNRHQVAAIIEYLDQAKGIRQHQRQPPPPSLNAGSVFGSGRNELGRRRSTSPISMKPLGGNKVNQHHPPDPAQALSETDSDPEVVLEKFLNRRQADKDKKGNPPRSRTVQPSVKGQRTL